MTEPIERLERRRLLAATITPIGHLLRIEGTPAADNIQFSRYKKHYAHIDVDGALAMTIDLRHYKEVSFAGGAGDDVLVMGHVPVTLYADGGDGNDAVSASSTADLPDTLLGGSGNDYLYGGPGNDSIDGGAGDDGMFGDAGNDTIKVLSDSTGDDTVSGGTGIDTADFTGYTHGITVRVGDRTPGVFNVNDFVFGDVETVLGTAYADNISVTSGKPVTAFLGTGNDTFVGGKGNDTVYGGRGDDDISTAGGNDLIVDQLGTNTIDGGTGHDTAFVAAGDTASHTTSVELVLTDISKLTVVGGVSFINAS